MLWADLLRNFSSCRLRPARNDLECFPNDLETFPNDLETLPNDLETLPNDSETFPNDSETAKITRERRFGLTRKKKTA